MLRNLVIKILFIKINKMTFEKGQMYMNIFATYSSTCIDPEFNHILSVVHDTA